MTENPSVSPDHRVGSFAEAARFRLCVALGLTHSERLRDLEAMWDFNDMIEKRNPQVRDIAQRLRERRERRERGTGPGER